MHFHFYSLCHLRDHIEAKHLGERLDACFSQNKNELILAFERLVLRIGCNTPATYIVPFIEFSKAKKNVVHLFQDLLEKPLKSVSVVPFERIMVLDFEEGWKLLLKMHGNAANVLLQKEDEIIELFNKSLEADWELVIEGRSHLDPKVEDELELLNEGEVLKQLKTISPIYEKQYAQKVFSLIQEGKSFYEAFKKVIDESKNDQFFLVKEAMRIRFLLFPPVQKEHHVAIQGIVPALQLFMRLHFQFSHYRDRYAELSKRFEKPYKKIEKVLKSYQKSIHKLETERSAEEIGHILMANLHIIPKEAEMIELDDLYQGGKVKISLKAQKSPQENAQLYYEKHKDRKAKLAYLIGEIEEIEAKLGQAGAEWEAFNQLVPPKDLALTDNGFLGDDLQAIKRLWQQSQRSVQEAQKERYPYRHLRKMNYDIFIGKNAKNNDELSFKFASKEDLWLHAKGVGGSHVVIRTKAGENVPFPVLEYAAQLAAFYSKSKNDTLVPVIYTPRKYIRKRKGDPAGMVVVSREKIIMVEPQKGGS